MLLRRFIGLRMGEYYAQPSHKVVGTPRRGDVDFAALLGEWHWRWLYRRAYRDQEGQWLTPVELFRPHYSRIIANFIARSRSAPGSGTGRGGDPPPETDVVELGGGRGTNASLILSHLRDEHPEIYDAVSYTVIDSSPTLHELQRDVLGSGEHGDKVTLLHRDAADIAEYKVPFLGESETPTVAIALELLDNLPHDKICRNKETGELQQAEVRTAEEISDTSADGATSPPLEEADDRADTVRGGDGGGGADGDGGGPTEAFAPLTDPALAALLADAPSYAGTGTAPRWVPTAACGLLRRLLEERPASSVLLADFDWLPPPDLPSGPSPPRRRSAEAAGEPLITCMEGRDHECYLTAPRRCDILFPTDFHKLAELVRRQGRGPNLDVRVMKQAEFLVEYGPEEVEATRSRWTGYTPLLHDFSNYSVLAVTGRGGAKRGDAISAKLKLSKRIRGRRRRKK